MKKFLFWFVWLFLWFSAFTIYAQENPYIVYNEWSWLITIYATDFSYGITLQDKNLWAENVWDYWYYYQWGNNNWKLRNSGFTGVWLIRKDSYDNHWYDWEILDFIDSQGDNFEIWDGDAIHDNVWWGWNDNDTSDANVVEWFNIVNHEVTNVEWRQWPCDTWYHVPSAWEWIELVKLYFLSIDRIDIFQDFLADAYGDYTHIEYLDFITNMKLSHAGSFDIQGSGPSQPYEGLYWEYWTSSPNYFSIFDISSYVNSYFNGSLVIRWRDHSAACSLRCFKNNYVTPNLHTIEFNSNWGENLSWTKVLSWSFIELPWTTREYYTFSWWYTEQDSWDFIWLSWTVYTPIGNITLYAQWLPEEYTITYELDGWTNSENNTWIYTIETPDITLENPTKDWYTFNGWFTDIQFTTWVTTIPTWTTWNITLYAKWTKIETKPSWGSSGGGGRSKTSNDEKDVTNNPSVTDDSPRLAWQDSLESGAQWDSDDGSSLSRGDTASAERGFTQTYTQEFQQAYEFAKWKWITTMPTIQKADMDGKLTRIAMAKMLSQYAMNVLWQKPENIVTPKFNDVTDKQNSDYDDWVTLAYQLGIMWQNMPNNKFRPDDEVTRAEFATALSRMIYHTSDGEYKSTPKYYIHHMEKLVKEWIITKDDPNMKELRGYVMIMLMRSAK